jgi:hypothetical protein
LREYELSLRTSLDILEKSLVSYRRSVESRFSKELEESLSRLKEVAEEKLSSVVSQLAVREQNLQKKHRTQVYLLLLLVVFLFGVLVGGVGVLFSQPVREVAVYPYLKMRESQLFKGIREINGERYLCRNSLYFQEEGRLVKAQEGLYCVPLFPH